MVGRLTNAVDCCKCRASERLPVTRLGGHLAIVIGVMMKDLETPGIGVRVRMKSGRVSGAYLTRRKGYPVLLAGPMTILPGQPFFGDEVAEVVGWRAGMADLVDAFNFEVRRVGRARSRSAQSAQSQNSTSTSSR